jgi:hypothetical protein
VLGAGPATAKRFGAKTGVGDQIFDIFEKGCYFGAEFAKNVQDDNA